MASQLDQFVEERLFRDSFSGHDWRIGSDCLVEVWKDNLPVGKRFTCCTTGPNDRLGVQHTGIQVGAPKDVLTRIRAAREFRMGPFRPY